MPDREKVIKGLEKCKHHECDDCTEKGASKAPWDCPAYDNFVDNALVLLKEQEAVEPVESGIPGVLLCGACKCSVMREEGYRFRHCPWCGKKVKWDD